jgi:D-galactarolactone cycloisomerase
MKIREVKSHVLKHPLPEAKVFGSSKGWHAGWGEAYGPPAINRVLVDEMYAPRLVGRDPLDHAVIWEDLYGTFRDYGRKGWPIAAISAVDIALWDLKGKALGQPIAKLLGGAFRTQLRAYATGLYRHRVEDNARALAREAEGYAVEGFRAMKMKVGFGLEEDTRNVRAVRAAIGPDRLLAMDANHGYDAGQAIRFGRKVEDQDLAWFEEPVVPEDVDGYCQVKAAVRIPVAGGEAEYARWGFRDLCARRAVDIAQPDICACGGFTEAWRIAALASAHGITVFPHVWGTAVGLFASLQLAAALPPNPPAMISSELLFELDRTPNPLRDELAQNPPKRAGDIIDVPTGPGLGVEIDRRVLERYRA